MTPEEQARQRAAGIPDSIRSAASRPPEPTRITPPNPTAGIPASVLKPGVEPGVPQPPKPFAGVGEPVRATPPGGRMGTGYPAPGVNPMGPAPAPGAPPAPQLPTGAPRAPSTAPLQTVNVAPTGMAPGAPALDPTAARLGQAGRAAAGAPPMGDIRGAVARMGPTVDPRIASAPPPIDTEAAMRARVAGMPAGVDPRLAPRAPVAPPAAPAAGPMPPTTAAAPAPGPNPTWNAGPQGAMPPANPVTPSPSGPGVMDNRPMGPRGPGPNPTFPQPGNPTWPASSAAPRGAPGGGARMSTPPGAAPAPQPAAAPAAPQPGAPAAAPNPVSGQRGAIATAASKMPLAATALPIAGAATALPGILGGGDAVDSMDAGLRGAAVMGLGAAAVPGGQPVALASGAYLAGTAIADSMGWTPRIKDVIRSMTGGSAGTAQAAPAPAPAAAPAAAVPTDPSQFTPEQRARIAAADAQRDQQIVAMTGEPIAPGPVPNTTSIAVGGNGYADRKLAMPPGTVRPGNVPASGELVYPVGSNPQAMTGGPMPVGGPPPGAGPIRGAAAGLDRVPASDPATPNGPGDPRITYRPDGLPVLPGTPEGFNPIAALVGRDARTEVYDPRAGAYVPSSTVGVNDTDPLTIANAAARARQEGQGEFAEAYEKFLPTRDTNATKAAGDELQAGTAIRNEAARGDAARDVATIQGRSGERQAQINADAPKVVRGGQEPVLDPRTGQPAIDKFTNLPLTRQTSDSVFTGGEFRRPGPARQPAQIEGAEPERPAQRQPSSSQQRERVSRAAFEDYVQRVMQRDRIDEARARARVSRVYEAAND